MKKDWFNVFSGISDHIIKLLGEDFLEMELIDEDEASTKQMIDKLIIKAYEQGQKDFAMYEPERNGNEPPKAEDYFKKLLNE